MIPPVEERAVRPCEDCIYCDDEMGYCHLENTIETMKERQGEYWKVASNNILTGYSYGVIRSHADKTYPCKYNITEEEVKELIDSGAV